MENLILKLNEKINKELALTGCVTRHTSNGIEGLAGAGRGLSALLTTYRLEIGMTGQGLGGQGKLERIESEQEKKNRMWLAGLGGDRQARTGLAGTKADKKGLGPRGMVRDRTGQWGQGLISMTP